MSKDPAWNYCHLQNPQDRNATCNFCEKVMKGGIYRAKQHIVGGYRNVQACKKCPEHVKEEIREYMSKKKEEKEYTNLLPDFDDMDDQDEDDVAIIDVKGKRVASGTGSNNIQSKKQKQKGPIDLYFTPPPEVAVQNRKNDKGKQTTIDSACKKELRNRACQRFARWMYDAEISFNALNYDSFAPVVEAIGQHGPGMKPPSYHEVRVPLLKKELGHTDNLMRDHKEEWAKYGCTIMADGWEDKRLRCLINFLVNCPKGTMFIQSVDASSYSKTGEKMFDLLNKSV
ncbi:uncharacterized protein LOC132306061 [Cornus florida]|uniref:uncharacterized protein LOC132306061 n=1 Tax=Cornus florida TaxID=4283 RepID=UPI0028A1ADEC|nr:uncharacterized protein LOC132306061 [Cornus florida]